MGVLLILVGLLATSFGFVAYRNLLSKTIKARELVYNDVSEGIEPHLDYQQKRTATALLDKHTEDRFVVGMIVLDDQGDVFVSSPDGFADQVDPSLLVHRTYSYQGGEKPKPEGASRREGKFYLYEGPIFIPKGPAMKHAGTLFAWQDHSVVEGAVRRQIGLTLLGYIPALLVGLLLLPKVAKWLTRPAVHLSETAAQVADTGNYALRATKFDDDEFGVLTDHFNQMMGTIEAHHEQQQQVHKADQVALSASLARAKRLESIGTVAGGVAHDLNNILGPMVALPDLIAQRLPAEVDAKEELSLLSTSARKAAAVIKDLLTLARRTEMKLVPLDLNEVVRDCLGGIGFRERFGAFREIEISEQLVATPLPVRASDAHLGRVVFNLVINAAEAYEDVAGRVVVQTEERQFEAPENLYEEIPRGRYAVFSVQDFGCGIAPSDFDRILEPFFSRKSNSAKRAGSGSGLGLAVVYGVVKDHGGFIDIKSQIGVGTEFRVLLPLAETVEDSVTAAPVAPYLGAGRRVLVVDDDEGQRLLAESLLGSMEFLVETAHHGAAGIDFVKERSYDLLLLDMVMEEGMDGFETLRQIQQIRPGLPTILMTGYSQSERVAAARELGPFPCLSKPFTAAELTSALKEVLR